MTAADNTWEYFSQDDIVDGMEKFLDDGSALDVVRYCDSPEWCWLCRIWDENTQEYDIYASYDDDRYFEHIDEAYTALCEFLTVSFPQLIARDEIESEPENAKRSFAMRVVAVGLAAALSISALAGCSSPDDHSAGYAGAESAAEYGYSAEDAWAALEAAQEIVVDKDFISMGDHWAVYADGEYVADINGEFIKIWDCYVMRSTSGDFMCAEEENWSMLRAKATKVGENGEEQGRYEQNFSIFLTIDFFDASGSYMGRLAQDPGHFMLHVNIEDADGNIAYTASKELFHLGAQFTITKTGEGNMSVEDAVMSTVIANELTESDSNN